MVALVTGSTGFLGGYILHRLEEDGIEVSGAGRPDIEIPSDAFSDLMAALRPSLVVHCAGPASVGGSIEDPMADLHGSVEVLAGLLEIARGQTPPPRVLFISSAAVYGDPTTMPIPESQRPAPVSPYGFHRLACELLLGEYHSVYGVPTAALRVFSAYGEGLRRQILWDVCRKAVRTGRVELEGTGSESRDFIHARDVAEATLAAVRAAAFEGEVYNVGSGRETTIARLARLAIRELGLDEGAIAFSGSRRVGDPANWRADIARMRSLGFEPRIEVESGVASYTEWAVGELAERPAYG